MKREEETRIAKKIETYFAYVFVTLLLIWMIYDTLRIGSPFHGTNAIAWSTSLFVLSASFTLVVIGLKAKEKFSDWRLRAGLLVKYSFIGSSLGVIAFVVLFYFIPKIFPLKVIIPFFLSLFVFFQLGNIVAISLLWELSGKGFSIKKWIFLSCLLFVVLEVIAFILMSSAGF